ncbi:VOC family protein [Chengkuizengella axinellae]|uniref:VOC family protein n=1 Tax=Chengkuizengella axinellae TaxID=3064388 RepID=A0ABT9J1Q9_9BACL|nr:VOC family protein [Chengkuizengella sp. 2205SS18-9]MDP5275357.1 VOC family protein [Chengkuizengella sp. 2205SS18-9]
MNNIKNIHHVAIEVSDLRRSVEFYKTLGFTVEKSIDFQGEEVVFLVREHLRLELYEVEGALNKSSNDKQMHLAFEVESWSGILDWITENKLIITEGPFNLENGWRTIFVKGYDGEILEFMQC